MNIRVVLGACLALVMMTTAGAQEYEGFPDRYVVQVGDLNGDGRTDLHLQFRPPVVPITLDDLTIPIAPPLPVQDFVLQQNTSGGFDLVTNLTAAQRAAVAAWPESSAVKLVHGDINVDGYMDIVVRQVASAIPQARDVIVFAPDTHGAPPFHVRTWDSELEMFFRDVIGWIENPLHYYDPGLYTACVPAVRLVQVQHTDMFGNVWYTWEWELVAVCGTFLDPTGFSIPALSFLSGFVYSINFGDLIPGVDEAPFISQVLQSVLGVPIMRGTLESGGQDFGLPASLRVLLEQTEQQPTLRNIFLDRLRLVTLWFQNIKKLVVDTFCDPPGTPHFYQVQSKVCSTGANCTPGNVYFTEQLVHPAPGYWDNKTPIQHGQDGYAELGCTREIKGACDPIRMIGIKIPGVGIFDGGPIHFERYDSQLHHANVTDQGHLFHPGRVDRWSQPAAGGGVQIYTQGTGTGACPLVNTLGGIYLFRTLDKFIECHLAGGCNKQH